MRYPALTVLWRIASTAATCAVVPALVSCGHYAEFADKTSAAMRTVSEPPPSVPHALMRISTDGFTSVQPGTACDWAANPRGGVAVVATQLYVGARGVTGQVLGVVGEAPKGVTSGELRVAADEPVTVPYTANWAVGNLQYVCRLTRSFVPVQGAHYQLLTSVDTRQQRCGMVVLQLAPEPMVVQLVDAPKCKLP